MGKSVWTFRPPPWLEKEVANIMKKHPELDRSKALLQYIINLNQLTEQNKCLREKARYDHKKAEKAEKLAAKALQKEGSTSKLKQEQQLQVTVEWINKWLPLMLSKKELLNPFPCPFEDGKFCYRHQRQQCRRKTRSKFDQCEKEFQIWLFNLKPR